MTTATKTINVFETISQQHKKNNMNENWNLTRGKKVKYSGVRTNKIDITLSFA